MGEPLAYHITWTTHGTWLPGDERGWVRRGVPGVQAPDPDRREEARQDMREPALVLDAEQCAVVEATVRAHCVIRRWTLHALNARTTHVHVVVTAAATDPTKAMDQLKSWCSRRLNERTTKPPERWWTRHGSTKWINDEDYFHRAVRYVSELQ